MKQWGWAILMSLSIGLLACGKSHDVINPANLRHCQAKCVKQLQRCHHQCDNDCQQCIVPAEAVAEVQYQQFVHQQTIQGGLVARDLKSYRDPLQCVKTTCNCQADYYQCAQACTGTIHKRLQSPLTCC